MHKGGSHCISLEGIEKIIFNLIIEEEHNIHGKNNLYYWCLFGYFLIHYFSFIKVIQVYFRKLGKYR